MEDLIGVREACAMLGRTRFALIEWGHAGFGPPPRKLGWAVFYRRSGVEAFIAAGGLEDARRGGVARAAARRQTEQQAA